MMVPFARWSVRSACRPPSARGTGCGATLGSAPSGGHPRASRCADGQSIGAARVDSPPPWGWRRGWNSRMARCWECGAELEEVQLAGAADRLGPAGDLQFGEDAVDVGLDGADGDRRRARDLRVGPA